MPAKAQQILPSLLFIIRNLLPLFAIERRPIRQCGKAIYREDNLNASISAALRAVPSEAKEGFLDLRANWPLLSLGMMAAAGGIAFLNYELSGFLWSLALTLGIVLFCALTLIGAIVSWLFFTGLTWRTSEARHPRRRIRRLADDDIPKRFWFFGFLITMAWMVPLYAVVIGAVAALS